MNFQAGIKTSDGRRDDYGLDTTEEDSKDQ